MPKTITLRTREAVAACSAVGLTYWSDHPAANHLWAADFQGRFHTVRIDRKKNKSEHTCGKYLGVDEGRIRCPDSNRIESWSTPASLDELSVMLDPTTTEEDNMATTTAKKTPAKKAAPKPAAKKTPAKKAPAKKAAPKPAAKKAPAKKTEDPFAKSDAMYAKALAKLKDEDSAISRPRLSPITYSAPIRPKMTLDAAIAMIQHDPDYLEDIDNENLVKALGQTRHDAKVRAELKSRGLTPAKRNKEAS